MLGAFHVQKAITVIEKAGPDRLDEILRIKFRPDFATQRSTDHPQDVGAVEFDEFPCGLFRSLFQLGYQQGESVVRYG